jgi:hypothetical protein
MVRSAPGFWLWDLCQISSDEVQAAAGGQQGRDVTGVDFGEAVGVAVAESRVARVAHAAP